MDLSFNNNQTKSINFIVACEGDDLKNTFIKTYDTMTKKLLCCVALKTDAIAKGCKKLFLVFEHYLTYSLKKIYKDRFIVIGVASEHSFCDPVSFIYSINSIGDLHFDYFDSTSASTFKNQIMLSSGWRMPCYNRIGNGKFKITLLNRYGKKVLDIIEDMYVRKMVIGDKKIVINNNLYLLSEEDEKISIENVEDSVSILKIFDLDVFMEINQESTLLSLDEKYLVCVNCHNFKIYDNDNLECVYTQALDRLFMCRLICCPFENNRNKICFTEISLDAYKEVWILERNCNGNTFNFYASQTIDQDVEDVFCRNLQEYIVFRKSVEDELEHRNLIHCLSKVNVFQELANIVYNYYYFDFNHL